MLPDRINEIFDTIDFEETGYTVVNSIEFQASDVVLYFEMFLGDDTSEKWKVEIKNIVAHEIRVDLLNRFIFGISFSEDHPILWEFTDYQSSLFFSSLPENPDTLLADIYKLHKTLFDDWVPLEKYLNGKGLYDLCRSPFGLFAKGSNKLLTEYASILDQHNIVNNLQGMSEPVYWDINQYRKREIPVKLLFFGTSYFVAENFEFTSIR